MEILPYEPAMLTDVAAAYNDAIRDVPHCYPVNVEDLEPALAGTAGGQPGHVDVHSEAAWIAKAGASVLGLIHAGVGQEPVESAQGPGRTDRGIVRFFCYARGQRSAGQALLEAAHRYLREQQIARIEAFGACFRYPFYYMDHANLSDRLDQVRALLQLNGYEPYDGEVFFDWPDYGPVDPVASDVPVEFSPDFQKGSGARPNLTLSALRDGDRIGECICASGGEFSRAAEAQDWLFVRWLGIDDEHQGAGLGRQLLQHALKEMHAVGYRHAAISTDWKNYRAFVFYSNYGFRVTDWTYGLAREL